MRWLTLSAAFVVASCYASLTFLSEDVRLVIRRLPAPLKPPIPKGHALPESCDYFYGREKFLDGICNITLALKNAADASDAGGCVPAAAESADCPRRPPFLVTHTWFNIFSFKDDVAMRKTALLLRAWMLTQDLRRSRFVVWASTVLPDGQNASLVPWFAQFAPYVSLRPFDYATEIASTPLSLSRHFNTWERFDEHTRGLLALQSDVFRNVILYNHGGLWLDTDAVPLRDLWDISAGLGLQFVPKFKGFIANGHLMYVRCARSALARRRLEHMSLFPLNHADAWPRAPSAGGESWVYNDALSDYARASQAVRYNLSQDGEEIRYRGLPAGAWEDLEVPFPITWFDSWWACHGPPPYNTSDFFRRTACEGVYVWHRLTKHIKGHSTELGPFSGATEFWDEIFDGPDHDHKRVRPEWPAEPRILTGGLICS